MTFTYGHALPLYDPLPTHRRPRRIGIDARVRRVDRAAFARAAAAEQRAAREQHACNGQPGQGQATPVIDSRARARSEAAGPGSHRSEEHTSELQSLMRISYAVFCLKKKKHTTHTKK